MGRLRISGKYPRSLSQVVPEYLFLIIQLVMQKNMHYPIKNMQRTDVYLLLEQQHVKEILSALVDRAPGIQLNHSQN
ncbi:hypothetical protein DJ564_13380 [Pseudomonas sp. 31-12]|nr:hypothetical protein DJ564_13380 [Pseudomonas sp. 31-12]